MGRDFPTVPRMSDAAESLELSVVIPCLNEAETLESCLKKAFKAVADHGIRAEVIVADNGSSDGSVAIAERCGARVISVTSRGYGSALMGGIAAARGRFILMGDADDSYDFLEIPKFVDMLRKGFDLVQGCRLPSGGGTVLPGAMPFSHRWIGNPMFSLLARWWFKAPIHDVYCGMRGFTSAHYERLNQRCTGMEFATEMILKSSLFGAKIAEVPITLHPDGRTLNAPHLKTFRDGWRTLRFYLMSSPRWLFNVPGWFLIALGTVGYAVIIPGLPVFGVYPDAHSLLFSTMAILCGYQSVLFAIMTKAFAIDEGLLPVDERLSKFFQLINLERGLLLSILVMLGGFLLLGLAVGQWRAAGYGPLNYAHTMRYVIPGFMFVVLGFQTFLSSFFVSILSMVRK